MGEAFVRGCPVAEENDAAALREWEGEDSNDGWRSKDSGLAGPVRIQCRRLGEKGVVRGGRTCDGRIVKQTTTDEVGSFPSRHQASARCLGARVRAAAVEESKLTGRRAAGLMTSCRIETVGS